MCGSEITQWDFNLNYPFVFPENRQLAAPRALSPITDFLPKHRPGGIPYNQAMMGPVQEQPLDFTSKGLGSNKNKENIAYNRTPLTSSPIGSPEAALKEKSMGYDYDNNIPCDLSIRSRSTRNSLDSFHSLHPKLARLNLNAKTMNDGGQGLGGNPCYNNLDFEVSMNCLGGRGLGDGDGGGDGGDDLNGNGGSGGDGGNNGPYSLPPFSTSIDSVLNLVQPSVYPTPENARFLSHKACDKSSEYPSVEFPANMYTTTELDDTDEIMSQGSYYSMQSVGHIPSPPLLQQTQPTLTQVLSNPTVHSSVNMLMNSINGIRSPDGQTMDHSMTQVR